MNRLYAVVVVMIIAGAVNLKAQSNPVSDDAKHQYASIKNILLTSAEKMPEADYSFKPGSTPEAKIAAAPARSSPPPRKIARSLKP